jgi:hypothetical protein
MLDQATAASEQDSYPDTVRRRVLYVLNVEPVAKYGNCLTVEAMSVQLLRNGGVSSKASTVSAGNMVNTGFQPAYLQQSDLFVLRSDTVGESFEANKSINWAGNRRQSSLNPYGLAEGAGLRSDTDVDASKRF